MNGANGTGNIIGDKMDNKQTEESIENLQIALQHMWSQLNMRLEKLEKRMDARIREFERIEDRLEELEKSIAEIHIALGDQNRRTKELERIIREGKETGHLYVTTDLDKGIKYKEIFAEGKLAGLKEGLKMWKESIMKRTSAVNDLNNKITQLEKELK